MYLPRVVQYMPNDVPHNHSSFPLNSSDSIKLIELIWKTIISSLERAFLLPILFLLYIVLLLLVTVNIFMKVITHGKLMTVMFIYYVQ